MKTSFAVVFPGQGSQYVGMLADWAEHYPIVLETFAMVSARLGYDLWHLVQTGPEEKLNQTLYTQVAMLTADVAMYRVLMEKSNTKPTIMAGHSLGEYAALVCAGAIALEDAALLVIKRAEVMQEAVPLGIGAMAAIIGLDDQTVLDVCEKVSTLESTVMPANYNALGQVVIAGHFSAVERAMNAALLAEARMVKIIPVSVPCHCVLLKDAAVRFAEDLLAAPLKVPQCAVMSNVDLSIYSSVDDIRRLLAAQLYHPVRWVETIQAIRARGVEEMIECGPGKILSGLIKRIDRALVVRNLTDLEEDEHG